MDNKLIYELLKEVREDQKDLAEKSARHREETTKWQLKTDSRMERIEVDLREHKEGVIQNRSSLDSHRGRIEELEQPEKAKKYLYKKWMNAFKFIAAGGTALGFISKYLGWW